MASTSGSLQMPDTIHRRVTQHDIANDLCPLCEQPIPHDRLQEIQDRMEAREHEQAAAVAAQMQERFSREKAELTETIRREATASMQASIDQANTAKAIAERAAAASLAQIEEVKRTNEQQLEVMRGEYAAREDAARKQAAESATAAAQARLAELQQAQAAAESKALAAEHQLQGLQAAHDQTMVARLQEQREAFEKAQQEAVNAEKKVAFDDKMKLSTKVEELQRALDKKTAEERGEGAEIDLYETLRSEFPADRIDRVGKGQPGADIIHVVVHNGRDCGAIIYDSKNHNAWRNEFVSKLASDQMAAKAEHAILATRTFPSDARQLHIKDGVVIANPSRVAALVQIIRQQLIRMSTLRLSNEAKEQKTEDLYRFITSERCADLFSRIDTHADDLLELQEKEQRAHTQTWKRQGELIRNVQKVSAELTNEIDIIIGVSPATQELDDE
jgi:hypothetical protein